MPACRNCPWFFGKCVVPVRHDKEGTEQCTHAILQKYLHRMRGEILEIGHGVGRGVRRHMAKEGIPWKGIDPRWPSTPENGHFQGTAANIPFGDETQDWVFGTSTMEHWIEYDEDLPDCIREIYRVLKPGGHFMQVAPIHYHGDARFYYGYVDQIMAPIFNHSWQFIELEEWRRDHFPLPKSEEWAVGKGAGRQTRLLKEKEGERPSTYLLEIYCRK